MARLDASAVLKDEGVREDGGLDLPRRAIGMNFCLIPQFCVSLAAVSISSALCSWSSVREPCSATRVANRSAKSSMPSCGSGPGSVGIAVGGCVCSSCTDRYSEVVEEASVLGSRTGGVVGAELMPPAPLPPPTAPLRPPVPQRSGPMLPLAEVDDDSSRVAQGAPTITTSLSAMASARPHRSP